SATATRRTSTAVVRTVPAVTTPLHVQRAPTARASSASRGAACLQAVQTASRTVRRAPAIVVVRARRARWDRAASTTRTASAAHVTNAAARRGPAPTAFRTAKRAPAIAVAARAPPATTGSDAATTWTVAAIRV